MREIDPDVVRTLFAMAYVLWKLVACRTREKNGGSALSELVHVKVAGVFDRTVPLGAWRVMVAQTKGATRARRASWKIIAREDEKR